MTTETIQETTKVDPTSLAPDFENLPGEVTSHEYPFWLGLTRDCPCGQIDVAGLHFPRYEEKISTNDAGAQVRVPVDGSINKTVSKHHFEALKEVLPRLVIRMDKPVQDDGTGAKNTGDPVSRGKGRLIKIPNKRMIAGASEHGRALKPYVRRPGDIPAVNFMYFVHAPSGKRGDIETVQTIGAAGIEWPEVIEEMENLLS